MNFIAPLSTLVLGLALATSTPSIAGPGGSCHFHGSAPASEAVVLDCATQRKATLVTAGKLDKSWQLPKADKVEQVEGKKGKEWRVTFNDPAAKDKAKQTLYMFFTLPGNFIAANFTGQ